MCISPKSSRSGNITNINSFINPKISNKNNVKEESNKYSKKKLSSRNNEILKAPKKNIYKKILPNSIFQFSSNNSTSSNTTSNFNNIKSHNHINFDYDTNSYKNPEYLKRVNKKTVPGSTGTAGRVPDALTAAASGAFFLCKQRSDQIPGLSGSAPYLRTGRRSFREHGHLNRW